MFAWDNDIPPEQQEDNKANQSTQENQESLWTFSWSKLTETIQKTGAEVVDVYKQYGKFM